MKDPLDNNLSKNETAKKVNQRIFTKYIHKISTTTLTKLASFNYETTHNYKLAKFLVPLLTPIAYSEHTVTDVFQFAKEIQQRTDFSRTLMVSLDIESLFTNVHVAETIEIILSKLFPDASSEYHGFTQMTLKHYLNWPLKIHIFRLITNCINRLMVWPWVAL